MLKIVADENIGFIPALLAGHAEVVSLPGRAIAPEHVRDADALIIRAVTPIDEALLARSRVRFVGTTTSGFDHVDREWLAGRGIAFAHAPGSNANSVAEYIVAALLELACRLESPLAGKALAVIGAGHIGARVAELAGALGLRVLLNDPPLREATGDGQRYRPLDEALAAADIVTLHVPLTDSGPHATRRMVNAAFLSRMKPGAWLINAARGPVADEAALAAALRSGHLAAAALDVWADEPSPDPALVRLAAIATPHIAGYSYNGRLKAVRMVAGALAGEFGLAPNWSLLDAALPELTLEWRADQATPPDAALRRIVAQGAYDIMSDDTIFRAAMLGENPAAPPSPAERAARFDALRKGYPRRYEFQTYLVLPSSSSPLPPALSALGFRNQ